MDISERFSSWKKTGQLCQKNDHVVRRHSFLRNVRLNDSWQAYERKHYVDMDESYIHHHFNCLGESLYDPDDDEDNPMSMQY